MNVKRLPSPLSPLPRERGTGIGAALAVMVPIAGCGPLAPPADKPFLLATARAAVAFAEAEIERERPVEPRSTCDECEGTGTVPSGDGLARVPCDCGSVCRCEATSSDAEDSPASQPVARRRRLLYFTASWCPTCKANEPTLAALRDRGWQIGPGEESHIQTVDLDTRPDLRSHFGVNAVPAWVFLDDGRELRRRYGVLDPFAVGRMFGDQGSGARGQGAAPAGSDP